MFENKIINTISIISVFYLASYLITVFLTIIEKASKNTKTNLDDKIIGAIKLPIRYLAILLGAFYATRAYELSWTIKNRQFDIADVFFVLIALLIGFTLSRILKSVFAWYGEQEKAKISKTMFVFIRKIISVFVYAIAILIIFSQFGIEIGPLLAGLGIAGLAIALGLQSTLENLFSALFLVMDKSISIGDWIQLEDGTKAYIEDISWRSVRIRTREGNTVIVPNSIFVGQKITSYDYPESKFDSSLDIGVSYNSDLDKVELVAIQATEKILKDNNLNIKESNPRVRFREFADSSINFIIRFKVNRAIDEAKIKHALIKEIKKQFEENKIEIPFPQRVIHQVK